MKYNSKHMRTALTISIISAGLFITGCKTELEKLNSEKAGLETTLTTTKKDLKEINEKLAKLDSTEEQTFAGITTIQMEKMLFEHYFEIQGSVSTEKNVIVVPEVGGLITSFNVSEGQKINKGTVIASFDTRLIASNKQELNEQIELAQYMYDKQKSLFDQGVGTELAVKQAEGQLKTLQKTLGSLNTQQGKFKVTAPFTGYVEEVYTVKGQIAGPGSPIIRLVSLDKLTVRADVSEAYLSKLNKSTNRADVRFPALDFELNNLKLERIGNFINPVNRTVVVEVSLPKTEQNILPNLMAVLRIKDYADSNAIVIPSRVILRDLDQEPYVFVCINDTVRERKITLGQSSGDVTEILDGVKVGEKVVDGGCRGVKNNQRVEVRN